MPMEQAQTHDGVKQVTVIPILPNVIILSYDSTDIKNTTHCQNIKNNVSMNDKLAGSMHENS